MAHASAAVAYPSNQCSISLGTGARLKVACAQALLSHLGTVAAFPLFPMTPPTATSPIVGEGSRHCRTAHTALYGSSLPTTSFD